MPNILKEESELNLKQLIKNTTSREKVASQVVQEKKDWKDRDCEEQEEVVPVDFDQFIDQEDILLEFKKRPRLPFDVDADGGNVV